MTVNFQCLAVHLISLSSHNGTPVGQVVFSLFYSHLLNLIHLACQTVGVVCFLDFELGLCDD